MPGLTIALHFGSAVSFMILVYLVVKLDAERRFFRKLIGAIHSPERVFVERPLPILEHIATTLGVPFHGADDIAPGTVPWYRLTRLHPGPLVRYLLLHRVAEIQVANSPDDKRATIVLRKHKPVADNPDAGDSPCPDFGEGISVQIS